MTTIDTTQIPPSQPPQSLTTHQLIQSLNTLFEKYRIVKELTFNVSKSTKDNQLSIIIKQISSIIDIIEHKMNINETKNDSQFQTLTKEDEISHAQYLYIKGRYQYISGVDCKPLLMKAIKLDPTIIECWNTLGDMFYNSEEILASKNCYELALDYDRNNKTSCICLAKILRMPIEKTEAALMNNAIQSLIMAKQALKYGKKMQKSGAKKNVLKDGELWFSLGNAYLVAFLRCLGNWKIGQSSIKPKRNTSANTDEMSIKELLLSLDNKYFSEQMDQISIENELRNEIIKELNDTSNNLLQHIYIRKCLSAYKCSTKKSILNSHEFHPDLLFNRSHIYIYLEEYEKALQDLQLSIKYSLMEIFDNVQNLHNFQNLQNLQNVKNAKNLQNLENISAKILYDLLFTKLWKISKKIGTIHNTKYMKKLQNFSKLMMKYETQCVLYFTTKLHYTLVHNMNDLHEGFNGASVIVLKILNIVNYTKNEQNEKSQKFQKKKFMKNVQKNIGQNFNLLPMHFEVIDSCSNFFLLSFYLKAKALQYMLELLNNQKTNINLVSVQSLVVIANPIKRHVVFNHGGKNIDFYTLTFEKPTDICIGGKMFYNQ